MEASADPTDHLTLAGVPVVVYIAMFGATLAGQLAGVALDALVGSRVLWVPAVCSVVLEGVAGARLAAARLGRPLAAPECARLSSYYSLGLAAVSIPLWGWTVLSKAPHQGPSAAQAGGAAAGDVGALAGASSHGGLGVVAVVLAAFVVATLARYVLMRMVSPRAASASPGGP